MNNSLGQILPLSAANVFRGRKFSAVFFLIMALAGLGRSCIHLFSEDGGAGSIAGLDLPAQGARSVVFAFALWGSSQLLFALLQLIVYFRYKSLIPLLYVFMILEILLRMLVGHLKPASFSHTPPGAIGNYVLLPVCSLMLYFSMGSGSHQ